MEYSCQFKEALENNTLAELRQIPKSDLHNHSGLGYKFHRFQDKWGHDIQAPPKIMDGIKDLNNYIFNTLRPYYADISGYEFALSSAFLEAQLDGVTKLQMSIDCWFLSLFENKATEFIEFIKKTANTYAPNCTFEPQLGMSRQVPIQELEKIIFPLIETGYFKSIDLYGDETSGDLTDFKAIFKKAATQGMKLCAHAGEFNDAEFIRKTIDTLEVTEIQHGISAIQSVEVMTWLRNNKIRLNICPSSNIVLNRVPHINAHPLRMLFDAGIDVTVNTDDILFFNNTVSEEYLLLYTSGLFSAEELNIIRLNGLTDASK